MTYRILPNTRAGANTEKSRQACVFHTVFYQIHAPAQTPKNPERRVYSIPYSTKYTRRHEHRKIQRGACIPYRILPNTRAGTNTEKSREERVFHTVFYQIHAPARTLKNPERSVYSIPYSTKYTRQHEHRKIQRGACIPYRILPNTRAGTNTEKSREARVFRSKSIDVEWLRGIPNLQLRF